MDNDSTAGLMRHGRPLKCLLVGYNGAGNTGADVRLIAAIDDVNKAFGPETEVTVITVNRERTLAILPAGSKAKVEEVSFSPLRFTMAIWRLVRQHDVTLLVEGSTFKQNWSVWLLHAYLWAVNCARWSGKYAIAYAVDVGDLKGLHAFRTRHECNRIALLITRTDVARQRLQEIGVTRPILTNTDLAFCYEQEAVPRQGTRRVVGMAPIEFFHWPVRLKPWCDVSEQYRWPYAFTWTPERRERSKAMVELWANLARHAIEHHDVDVKLIAMEDLDAPVCERILEVLGPVASGRVTTVSSEQNTPAQMVAMLRGLDALVTSRYHACVLSMGGSVPQMAICHDERLESIYAELEFERDLLLHYQNANLPALAIQNFDYMMKHSDKIAEHIRHKHDTRFVPMCLQNPRDLRVWGLQNFDKANPASLGNPITPPAV